MKPNIEERISYLYRHLTFDGRVFYIGIGKQDKFKRAYTKSKRSVFWHSTVNKYNYEVQLLKTDLTWEEACELEITLIAWYGRRDLSTGTLVNLTDGGDGAVGYIMPEALKIEKRKASEGENNYWFGKTLTEEHKNKIRESNTNNIVAEKHSRSKLLLSQNTGVFYYCVREASEVYNMKYSTLKAMLQGKNKNKTDLIYV